MPLLKRGRPIADAWIAVGDDAALPAAKAIVSLARWRAMRDGRPQNAEIGVRLQSHELAGEIADDLPRLGLVAVSFPKFRDGRAFSTVRALRERYGYKGEIRAIGHILPDQYLFLTRLGVDTVDVPDGHDSSVWEAALSEITVAYQLANTEDAEMTPLRRLIPAA